MKTYTFAIQKGGTGKTSVSVSVAVELAKIGRTILIDADPQGNTTDWMYNQRRNSTDTGRKPLHHSDSGNRWRT